MTYQGQLMGTLDDALNILFTGKAPSLDARSAGVRALLMPLTLNLIGFK